MKKEKPHHQYKVNPDQFITDFTPESVYILGLLWADGYIKNTDRASTVSLTTTYPDAVEFLSVFDKTGHWKHYDRTHIKWKTRCDIVTNNRPLASFLVNNDYTIKSNASANKILSIIPENLKHYWFRGLFDGDGHIHTDDKGSHRISISSSYDQKWEYMKKLCEKLKLKYSIQRRISKKGHSQSLFSIYGIYQSIKFCEYIYNNRNSDGQLGLNRKYETYLRLCDTEKKNRFVGVSFFKKTKKWRAYTSGAGGIKPKSLGVFIDKEKALEAVDIYYSTHPKRFLV